MNIAIVDDDTLQLDVLNKIVSKWFIKNNINLNINMFSSSETFLFSIEDKMIYDILLLDIEMKGTNGLELAKKMRQQYEQISIIFITGYQEYVFDSFRVQATDYILKPVTEEKINYALTQATENTTKNGDSIVLNTTKGSMIKITLSDVKYIESAGHNTILYHKSNNNTVTEIKYGISELESMLEKYNYFYRCHRSYIVNFMFIDHISKNEASIINGPSIPISREKRNTLNIKYIEYYRR